MESRSTDNLPTFGCAVVLGLTAKDRVRRHEVALDADDRFQSHPHRVLNRVNLGRRRAVEDDVQPVVAHEPLGCLELVRREADFAHSRASLYLDEAGGDVRTGLARMGLAREQVIPAILALDASNFPSE